jgi:hypothetical protein
VATIYMALAVNQTSRGQRQQESDIGITTIEKDGTKVVKAKSIWKEAGDDVEKWINAREGDLLEVLEQDETLPPVVDLVFLDGKLSLYAVSVDLLLTALLSMDFTSSTCFEVDHTEIAEWICYCSRQNCKRESTVSGINKFLVESMLICQKRYHEFLIFVRDPRNGFMSLTVPFPEGFEIIVYNRGGVLS